MTRRKACSVLKKFAKQNGLGALAEKIGCSKSFASLLINGKRNAGPELGLMIEEGFEIPQRVWRGSEFVVKRSAA